MWRLPHRLVAALAATALVGMPADAQPVDSQGYRVGQPPTLTPRPAVAPDEVGLFRRAWRGAGSPRIVVFWNRELSDEVATSYRAVGRVEETRNSEARVGIGPGTVSATESGSRTLSVEVETQRRDAPPRAAMPETARWAFESAFSSVFAEAGVRLVSRSAAMRNEATGVTGERPNVQALEMKAARRRADFLLELLVSPAHSGAAGYIYRVRVTRLSSAEVVADLTSEARPAPPDRQPYVATSRGFEPAPPPPLTVEGAGRELARQTMAALRNAVVRR